MNFKTSTSAKLIYDYIASIGHELISILPFVNKPSNSFVYRVLTCSPKIDIEILDSINGQIYLYPNQLHINIFKSQSRSSYVTFLNNTEWFNKSKDLDRLFDLIFFLLYYNTKGTN